MEGILVIEVTAGLPTAKRDRPGHAQELRRWQRGIVFTDFYLSVASTRYIYGQAYPLGV